MSRHRATRVLALAAAVLLAGPVVAWTVQCGRLILGCAGGLGNPGMTGRLVDGHCLVSDAHRPLARIPWEGDVLVLGLLLLTFGCVALSLLGLCTGDALTVVAVPVLAFAGMRIAGRIYDRAEGELFDDAVILPGDVPEAMSSGPVDGGWQLSVAGTDLVVPDVDMLWFGSAFLAGLVLLVLVAVQIVGMRTGADRHDAATTR